MSTGAASGLGPATLAAVACVLAAAGIRGLSDGLFHVTEDASSPSSYGVAGWRLLGVHAVMPLAGTASALAIGGALGAGTGVRLLPVWLATAAALAALNVMERAKGPMPDALYVPMSSPMGDPAPIFRAAWQVWPELASAAWGILIVLVSGSLPPAMGTVAVVGAATALAAGCWPRLRGR
jgi:hypothetical protein